MDVTIDFLKEKTLGRMFNDHSADCADSAVFQYAGRMLVKDTSGQSIHGANFSSMDTLLVVNVGSVAFQAKFPCTGAPFTSSKNTVTIQPGKFLLVPDPEHVTGKSTLLIAINSGDEGIAEFWISGS